MCYPHRYTPNADGDMVQTEDGKWVKVIDYYTLREKFDFLVAAESRRSEQLDAAIERVRALEGALGLGTPWPATDVLNTLRIAVNHLLADHNCDHIGYEAWGIAGNYAAHYVNKISCALAQPTCSTSKKEWNNILGGMAAAIADAKDQPTGGEGE